MNYRVVIRTVSIFIILMSLVLLFPLACAILYHEQEWMAFLTSSLVALVVGGAGYLRYSHTQESIFRREGFAIVGLGWIFGCIFGALPYELSGTVPSFIDAYFETVSGFTTTGATIMQNIEMLPRSVQFWRCFTNWLGGMGIIVLFVAIFPFLGVGGKLLFRSESSAATIDGMKPRIRETARRLWIIYLGFSLIEVLLLKFGGISWFDAICHTFSTMATGGFGNYSASIGYFGSAYIEWVIIFFMILAGTNFFLLYSFFTRRTIRGSGYQELKTYLGLIGGATLLVTASLVFQGDVDGSLGQLFRKAAFQVSSLMTTTGFVTDNYELWPPFTKVVLVLLMFIGGCAGSTGGGMKVIRILVSWRFMSLQIAKAIHPGLVKTIKLSGQPIFEETRDEVLGFFVLSMASFAIFSALLALTGLDVLTAASAVISTLWNIGPGLARVGAIENYAFIAPMGKLLLSFCMILGRLEFFALIVFFSYSYWQK